MHTNNPLILTLAIDDETHLYFNQLRKKHFPAERNFLDAHLSLFHQLPAGDPSIETVLEETAAQQPFFQLDIATVVSIGNGVAFKVQSDTLAQLHRTLQAAWKEHLIPQDQHKLYPHITIQNKVRPAEAKALLSELSADFQPFKAAAIGFDLWEYLGGPWRFIRRFEFR